MKIVVIGSPGSGKTWLAGELSQRLNLRHIEVDKIFWKEGHEIPSRKLIKDVTKLLEEDRWVIEGHFGKLKDIILPKVNKIIILQYPPFLSLIRSLKRDWSHPKRAYFNIQNYQKMNEAREKWIADLRKTRLNDVIFLDNFPDLNQSKLSRLCKTLKSSSF